MKYLGRVINKIRKIEYVSRPDNCGEVPDRLIEYDIYTINGSTKEFYELKDAKKHIKNRMKKK